MDAGGWIRPGGERTCVPVARGKPESRQRARELREQGWALRRIANEVEAALSSVSAWVRGIQPAVVGAGELPSPEVGSATDVQHALEHRRCGKCLQDLPVTSFNRHPTGLQWWCRECYRAYFRARAELHRQQVKAAREHRRRNARALIADYLRTHPCADCGEPDVQVLEFDHLDSKRGNVTDLKRAGTSVRALQQELRNCEVVCVNCHRLRTAARGSSWRLDPASVDLDALLTPGERRNMTYLRDLLMRSACVDCADSRLVVLDFDHIGAKTSNVIELARRGCSLRRLQAEISHCEIRCANCHRRRTVGRPPDEPEERDAA